MESRCTQDHDTICIPCKDGFYNEGVNYDEACKPCTQCNQSEHPPAPPACTCHSPRAPAAGQTPNHSGAHSSWGGANRVELGVQHMSATWPVGAMGVLLQAGGAWEGSPEAHRAVPETMGPGGTQCTGVGGNWKLPGFEGAAGLGRRWWLLSLALQPTDCAPRKWERNQVEMQCHAGHSLPLQAGHPAPGRQLQARSR